MPVLFSADKQIAFRANDAATNICRSAPTHPESLVGCSAECNRLLAGVAWLGYQCDVHYKPHRCITSALLHTARLWLLEDLLADVQVAVRALRRLVRLPNSIIQP